MHKTSECEEFIRNYHLKKIIKENHKQALLDICSSKRSARFGNCNLIATCGHTQVNIYDNTHLGQNLDLMCHYVGHKNSENAEDNQEYGSNPNAPSINHPNKCNDPSVIDHHIDSKSEVKSGHNNTLHYKKFSSENKMCRICWIDGNLLAAGTDHGQIQIISLSESSVIAIYEGHENEGIDYLSSTAVHDGYSITSSKSSFNGGNHHLIINDDLDHPLNANVTYVLISVSSSYIRMWNMSKNCPIAIIIFPNCKCAVFDGQRQVLYCGTSKGQIRIFKINCDTANLSLGVRFLSEKDSILVYKHNAGSIESIQILSTGYLLFKSKDKLALCYIRSSTSLEIAEQMKIPNVMEKKTSHFDTLETIDIDKKQHFTFICIGNKNGEIIIYKVNTTPFDIKSLEKNEMISNLANEKSSNDELEDDVDSDDYEMKDMEDDIDDSDEEEDSDAKQSPTTAISTSGSEAGYRKLLFKRLKQEKKMIHMHSCVFSHDARSIIAISDEGLIWRFTYIPKDATQEEKQQDQADQES